MRKRFSLNQNWTSRKDEKKSLISVPFVLESSYITKRAKDLNIQEGKSYFLEIRGFGSQQVFLNDQEITPISENIYPLTGLSQPDEIRIRTDSTLILHSITLIETETKSVFIKAISTEIRENDFIIHSSVMTDSEMTVRFSLTHNKEKTEGIYKEELHFADLHPWSTEEPYLYEFTVSVYDENNQLMDSDSMTIGFRKKEDISLFGVNYNACLSSKGYALSKDDIENDIKNIKESGFSFIHCVCDKTILSFCDKYGLLTITDSPSDHVSSFSLPETAQSFSVTDYLKHRKFHRKDIVSVTQSSEDLEELFRFFSMKDANLSYALLGDYENLIGKDKKNKTDSLRMIEAFLSKKKFTYILNKDRKTKVSRKMTIDVLSNEEELTLYVNNMKLATLRENILFSFTIPYFRTCNAVVRGKDSKDKATFVTESK